MSSRARLLHIPRHDLRGELVAILAGVLILGLGLVGVLSHAFLAQQLRSQSNAQLRAIALQLQSRLGGARTLAPPDPLTATRPDSTRPPQGDPAGLNAFYVAEVRAGTLVELRTTGDTAPLVDLATLEALPPGALLSAPDQNGHPRAWTLTRIRTLRGREQVIGVSTRGTELALHRFTELEFELGVGVLILCLLLGAGATSSSLAGLRRVRHTAEAISAGDDDARVVVEDSRTEAGTIALALNHMLESLSTRRGEALAAAARAEASEAGMRRFLADASHELRTPLTSIRGFAELLRLNPEAPPATTTASLARIEAEAVRMNALVEEMLLLARLGTTRALTLSSFPLTPVLEAVCADAHVRFPEREITLDAPADLVAHLDEARTHQVVANLVANACAYTDGPVEIRVEFLPTTQPPGSGLPGSGLPESGELIISVADRGEGLSSHEREVMFDRFWRGESSRTRTPDQRASSTGTGLGLSIVSDIVRAHAGRVSALEREGGGTRVEVRLPQRGPTPPD